MAAFGRTGSGRLICVRYRYDAASKTRYKTVELIVDRAPWTPLPSPPRALKPVLKVDNIEELESPPPHVGVKVFFRENALRERVKAAGGRYGQRRRNCGACLIEQPSPWGWNTGLPGVKWFQICKPVYMDNNMVLYMTTVSRGFYVVYF